ncbi:hypothetical protein ONE63_007352 [Megalurothrips usitatus]|uniref:RNA-directed DNA polymerase n=1 Tax=Megalurothrips usitatus TaxID=439358 RepID=A0AAV7XUE7_9NEOP|nr:hypothetical protein ONE63_007352 [Megalurothrips usitatus]
MAIELDKFPMPTVEDAFSALANCNFFSKLDLVEAYTQLPVDEETAQILTVNTHLGLFSVHRLPFGISSGPAIFQRRMTSLLAGINGVAVWLDDILIASVGLARAAVLRRLSEAGLRLHPTKCEFGKSSLEFLGFRLDADGLTPLRDRTAAILDAPAPKDVSELRSFIGKLNFYDKFLPNRATVFAPLYHLLKDKVPYVWDEAVETAFRRAKELLCSANLLVHYDLNKDLIVSCDASPVGVGAVLAHRFPDGTERPIEFASRALSPAERNYSQTDLEGLSIIFAVNKWHRYLAGRTFEIFTDHKSLLGLFGTEKPIPKVLSPRVERWLVQMGCYSYTISYRPGKNHGNADALSRLCVPGTEPKDVPEPAGLFLISSVSSPHLTANEVAEETGRDPVLKEILGYVRHGWPTRTAPRSELHAYWRVRDGLSIVRGCLLWGSRVVVPPSLRDSALRHLHSAHMGMVKTKSLARVLMWWPKLSTQIERMIAECPACQATRAKAPRLPTTPWPQPTAPWQRLHVDFAGPFHGKHFFVVVDAHTGWMDVAWVKGPTAQSAINALGTCFQFNGLPYTIVSNNGAAFRSKEFESFCAVQGIRQLFIAPGHPSSNGRAERMVRTVKEHLRRLSGNNWEQKLRTVLDSLRTTPGEDGRSPNRRLMGREVRTFLSLCKPSPLIPSVGPMEAKFFPGAAIWFKVHGRPDWQPGTVAELQGARMVILDGGHVRHADQLRRRVPTDPPKGGGQPRTLKVLPDISVQPQPATASEQPPEVQDPLGRQDQGQQQPPLVQAQSVTPPNPPPATPPPPTGKGRGRRSLDHFFWHWQFLNY